MSIVGGNSILSGGGLASPGNDLQVAAGIKDSPELLLADMLKSGGGLANVECAKVVAYGALDAYRWAKDFLGVKFDRIVNELFGDFVVLAPRDKAGQPGLERFVHGGSPSICGNVLLSPEHIPHGGRRGKQN